MLASDILLMARQRAGLTQEQLAARSGYARVSLARWENGTREPALSAVLDVVRAAGLDMALGLVAKDESLRVQARDQIAVKPRRRLESLLAPDELSAVDGGFDWLTGREGVIVVGQVGAILGGAPHRPSDANVELVASDIEVLTRDLEHDGWSPTDDPRRYADSDRRWAWRRRDIVMTIASRLPGTHRDFADLRRHAESVDVGRRRRVRAAHPRDLLRIAEASTDPQALARAGGLRAVVELIGDDA